MTTIGSRSIRDSLRLLGRTLTFRATREELLALNNHDLAVGLFFTWLVGIGRTWDNPRVELWQQLGLGSLAYIVVFSSFIWFFLGALSPLNWNWKRLLIFVSFTSPPGLLYAIPVQMIWDEPGLKIANEINLAFLGIVSLWRVSLLYFFLKRTAGLAIWESIAATLLPIDLIIIGLTILNLDRVVFDFMRGGAVSEHASPNDDIYLILMTITFISIWAILPLIFAFFVAMTAGGEKRRKLIATPEPAKPELEV